ncbi:LppU family putative lipoprotein [Rhodococcus sp. ACT016]|uniref:LppU family putative lipoprotein n=1 Tax=Rhodococcus sp. ACT016 TaxID=3134808 RepID=UPI003D292DF9
MWAYLRRSIGVASVVAATALVAGCGGTVEGTAAAADGAGSTTSSRTTTSAAPSTVAGQQGSDTGGSVDIDVEIGDCVRLGGTSDAATIAEAACGGGRSNYKVVAKAAANAQCPSDVDQVYYETKWGSERGALCLDVDWVIGGCMSLPDGEDEPQRVDCGDPTAPNIERAVEIIEGATDVEACSEGGFVHDERRFTVCTETVSYS